MNKFKELTGHLAYGIDLEIKEKLLLESLNECYVHHFINCIPYQKYCKKRGLTSETRFDDFYSFPYLPVQAFKEYGEFLKTIENKYNNSKSFLLNSSATSGRPSSIYVDRETAKRQALLMTKSLSYFLGQKKLKFIVADINPSGSKNSTLGARAAATLGFLKFSSEVIYILEENFEGKLQLNEKLLVDTLDNLKSSGEKFVFFGFTYVLFESILENQFLNAQFSFENQANLLHIGGWKKLESKKISKNIFNSLVQKKLGIPSRKIIDVYGFTEQMGIIYPSLEESNKICSTFSTVIVRDPVTLLPVPDGQEGVLQFLSPLPSSYPGFSVLTDDLGFICENESIDGVKHKSFKITGRAKNAEVRGCGDIMSSYVSVTNNKEVENQRSDDSVKIIWDKELNIATVDYLNPLIFNKYPQIDDLNEYLKKIKLCQEDLIKYNTDELIFYFSESSKIWIQNNSPLFQFKQEGLTFLSNWLNSNSVRANINYCFNGQRDVLDKFKQDKSNPIRKIRAFPKGVVVHWLAGNVPLLGMLALVQSIITKNVNILKAPSHNSGVLPALLNEIKNIDITLPTGKTVFGRDIVSAIGVVYYTRENYSAAESMSKFADLRIAWGGAESVGAVMSLPRKHTTEDVIFGPKVSYMAIGREFLKLEFNIDKLVKKVAIDCSVFDQYACASPHTIFIEEGGEISPKEFAEKLAYQMERAANRIPKYPVDGGTIGNIQSKRMKYEFTADVWSSVGTTWTVLLDNDWQKGLADPTYSRVITVRSIPDIIDSAYFSNKDIQTISLGLNGERKIKYANIAALLGASRFPEIGRMTHFDTPWDGLNLMQRLIRYVSLGGPTT
jgi:hypothetical protein